MQASMDSRHPVAYLRKSRVTSDRHVSWEVQEGAVLELAAQHGDIPGNVLFLSDWNRSGRGTRRRPQYRQLLEMIEHGEATAVYSYSLSRLARSLADFMSLVDLCVAKGVPIHLYSEKQLDFTTATGRLMVSILAAFAQMEAELAQERARDAVAVRRSRGDVLGVVPYGRAGEPLEEVLVAYREAGSVTAAAKLLTRKGVPTRKGGPWSPTSVEDIIDREWPDERPKGIKKGGKPAAPFIFAGLLECPCGRRLTGARYTQGRQAGYTVYRCLGSRSLLYHDVAMVPEKVVLTWAEEEMTHLQLPDDVFSVSEDTRQRDALNAKRRRILDNYEDGLLAGGKAERDEKLLVISSELELLDAKGRAVDVGPLDWSADPKVLNAALRGVWSCVKMGRDQRPGAKAEWLFPEWRRD